MITRIGLVAGEIWEYLDKQGEEVELEGLSTGIGKDRDVVLMSIGWLAREGHVSLEGESLDRKVKLTN